MNHHNEKTTEWYAEMMRNGAWKADDKPIVFPSNSYDNPPDLSIKIIRLLPRHVPSLKETVKNMRLEIKEELEDYDAFNERVFSCTIIGNICQLAKFANTFGQMGHNLHFDFV